MNEFELTVDIDRPVEDVWAFMEDYSRYPEWTPGVTEARKTSEGEMGVGSTVTFVGRTLGRRYESLSECTAYERNRHFATRSISGPFHLEVDNRFEPTEGGTRLISKFRGESRGFLKIAEPMAVRVTRKNFEAANENMKALLEAVPVSA